MLVEAEVYMGGVEEKRGGRTMDGQHGNESERRPDHLHVPYSEYQYIDREI